MKLETKENILSVVESLLFVSGDPLSVKKISKIMKKNNSETEDAIVRLANEYKENNRGLRIIRKEDDVQLVSAPEFKEYVNKLFRSDLEEDLSRVSLEVLSVIAYRGPVSRVGIEDVRGVNCSFTLHNLLMRGLIERVENPNDSRSYLYKVSFEFLKHLGLGDVKELPGYEELKKEFTQR